MTLLLDTCGTHTDHVYATDHLRKNQKPDTFASHNCMEYSLPHEYLGAAFSLVVIMQLANFLFWESLVSNLFDEVVAVRYNNIIESTIIRYF